MKVIFSEGIGLDVVPKGGIDLRASSKLLQPQRLLAST